MVGPAHAERKPTQGIVTVLGRAVGSALAGSAADDGGAPLRVASLAALLTIILTPYPWQRDVAPRATIGKKAAFAPEGLRQVVQRCRVVPNNERRWGGGLVPTGLAESAAPARSHHTVRLQSKQLQMQMQVLFTGLK